MAAARTGTETARRKLTAWGTAMDASTKKTQIRLTQRAPGYMRVTFDNPPLNVMGGQPDIQDQTFAARECVRGEKFLGRAEDARCVTQLSDQARQRLAHRFIIVDNDDQRILAHQLLAEKPIPVGCTNCDRRSRYLGIGFARIQPLRRDSRDIR
jgi:hypothetical protein